MVVEFSTSQAVRLGGGEALNGRGQATMRHVDANRGVHFLH